MLKMPMLELQLELQWKLESQIAVEKLELQLTVEKLNRGWKLEPQLGVDNGDWMLEVARYNHSPWKFWKSVRETHHTPLPP